MVDRWSKPSRHQVHLAYALDRLLANKLQQVYEILVPDRVRVVGEFCGMTEDGNGGGGDLCTGVIGQAAGGEHFASQTAALIDFARSRGFQVPDEWVFEDEGYSGATLERPSYLLRSGRQGAALA